MALNFGSWSKSFMKISPLMTGTELTNLGKEDWPILVPRKDGIGLKNMLKTRMILGMNPSRLRAHLKSHKHPQIG